MDSPAPAPGGRLGAWMAIIGASLLIVLALGLVLSSSPPVVAGSNAVPSQSYVQLEHGHVGGCEPAGVIPKGTSSIRVALEARAVGPSVHVKVLSRGRVITAGSRGAGWGVAPTLAVPIGSVRETLHDAVTCLSLGDTIEPLRVSGVMSSADSPALGGLSGFRVRMEYLRPGPSTWWSKVPLIAHHLGLGHPASGIWLAFLVLALMIVTAGISVRLALREVR